MFSFLIFVIGCPLWLTRAYNRLSKKIDRFFIKFDRNNKEKNYYVGNETNGYDTELIFNRNIFDHLVLHEFDGYKFLITDQYDHALKQRYGDYMSLPPEEQRKSHHCYDAFYK